MASIYGLVLDVGMYMTARTIRFATLKETSLRRELALCLKGYWGYDTAFLESCRQELSYNVNQLSSPAYCFKVAELNRCKMTGFFALNLLGSDNPELDALFIDPDFIGQGWGKYLLASAIAVAKAHNAKSIKLQADPFAEDFYLVNGAVKVGQTESLSVPGRFLPLLEICL
jgi:GNAT superfamily N-acetyltransferase